MMIEPGKIKKLDEVVINRIAAGEVIQRPANALKEMIENSLDAKATNIQISVKNGGLKLLQIQDDGSGIRREDFEIVCERFTTSKLQEFEDLNKISTYGFRGEALASISHVAHLTITSKTPGDICAYKASYEDGKLKENVQAVAGNQGTQITVEDLFYNMSVRKNALRSPAEEYQKISDVVGKYAIHNFKTGFALKKQGENNDIRTPSNSTVKNNIGIIYGNLISRELIEFNVENKAYKFSAVGYMTNINYSTKKMHFILFINHRLVDCQSLKKNIDQMYAMYLPKNMHPFVYISLEIEPRNIDVNVHPTKHEVHFLNEEQIVDIVSKAVDAKLLGSNNSRVFYTQAKLPGAPSINTTIKEADKTIYDKDLVRTDSNEQKLEKFFGPTIKKTDPLEEPIVIEEDKFFSENSPKQKVSIKGKTEFIKSMETNLHKIKHNIPVKLISVLQLQSEIENNCDDSIREIFSEHVFVGVINKINSLIQHGTKLYICNTQTIMNELFYQFLVFNFQNFNAYQFSDPLPIVELAKIALDLPETGWSPEDGDKNELANKIVEILTEKGDMLNEYFSMEIDDMGNLKSIPILIDQHTPDMSYLPMYILRLATEVNWEEEKECFQSFSRETANFYSNMQESENWEYVTEHVLYPTIKEYFCPSSEFKKNGAILQVADLPNLYKVFERC